MTKPVTLSEIRDELADLGAKPKHIRRIFRAWMHMAEWTERPSEHFPKVLKEHLTEIRKKLEGLSRVLPVQSVQADSLKMIVGLSDGECVEAVLLPREALCISTQVGCAVGCAFCMTGKGGLSRQLGSAEIVAQVAEALKIRPEIKKVVLMGMGEPSHNLDNVCEAIEFMGDVIGFAHKQIVVSSVGDQRLFDRLPTLSVKPAIALSLHTTDNEKRRRLLPKAPRLTVEELLDRTLSYAEATKYPAQIEWTLIDGVNDSFEEVKRLAELVKGRYAMVNFIAVNPGANLEFKRPTEAHMQDLITILRESGTVATIRDSAAQDIEGGCGQLRARVLEIVNDPKKAEI